MIDRLSVNTKLISEWVERNEPSGVEKLALAASESGISVSPACIRQVRDGHVPRPNRQKAIAAALGVHESILFPLTTV